MPSNSCIKENEMILYTVEDIQKIFRIGRSKAYQLLSMRGFPAIRLNRKVYVPKEKLEEWVGKNAGKQLYY